ncbi:hypothetical protein BS78_K108100 [Paspalum vaginatum]|uniref:Dynamin-type G domain-containing protein n=1 Tax=Paspalum vaginatum TaxID=158149 RepID=A0A9W7X9D5_9POAL|nr:hypothetical protein BS78_K108100 [Paspalum vaginatum]
MNHTPENNKSKRRRTKDKVENDVEDAKDAAAAIIASGIRPVLDAVDRLRHLKVTQEGIQLPTIVVVGDQSSGESSVLESLAGISLPRGQGICTRVPLVMRLQDDPSADSPKLQLEYSNGRVVATSEAMVADAINTATAEIAGGGKGISDAPITLVVRKRGVPDLTLVDLPGITRVPVQGQPEDIYDQIAKIIREYIAPKESIILNVLSATVDFPTCESIRMSQQVDRTGERTLAVVTKVDKAPEGLLEKVTMDDVHIGLGYVCVRNRVGEETYDQARVEEARLFKNHPLLSKIDRSMVGIPVLAQRLVQIQASIIAKCLPDILYQMPPDLNNTGDAVRAFFHIVKKVCSSLEKILVRGEFDGYPDDCYFHGTARVAEMLNRYAKKLPRECPRRTDELFLMEEMDILEETMGINLPNFLPRSAFHVMLKEKLEMVGQVPQDLVTSTLENFPQVQSSCRRAIQRPEPDGQDPGTLCAARQGAYRDGSWWRPYANPDYMNTWAATMEGQKKFMESVENMSKPTRLPCKALGRWTCVAFDLRARLTVYWKSIVLRLVDGLALHVLRGVKRLVENDLEEELANELLCNNMAGVERMLSPQPSAGTKRDRLKKSIALLQQSKEVVANIMDRISAADEH